LRARRLADGGLERLFADLDPSIHLDGDTLAVSGRVQASATWPARDWCCCPAPCLAGAGAGARRGRAGLHGHPGPPPRPQPSGVSEHLAALRDAGLLTSHRVGHQVIYERAPSPSPSPEPPRLQVGDPDPPPRGKAADTRIAMINSPLSAGNLELYPWLDVR
jgi:hypothetical protein